MPVVDILTDKVCSYLTFETSNSMTLDKRLSLDKVSEN